MTIDEVILLLKATLPNALTPLQELVLRSSWEEKTYTNIALEAHYGEERVRKVASHLWQLMSDFWKEPINKSNFRQTLEPRQLSRMQHQFIREYNRAATAISLEFPTGPVSLDSRFYIPRPPIEELAYTEIAEPGSVICIKAPKKMGKSSLVLRILAHATNLGYKIVSLDFQQSDKAVFVNLDKFLRWFCANLSRELQLELKLNEFWDEDMGSKISCSLYVQTYLLQSIKTPLVLVLNEVDWVFEYPDIASEFLPLLRSWYEQAKRVDIWQKLRMVMVYSTEFFLPLKVTQSPFNIGLPLRLPPFTKEQVQNLAQCHGLEWTDNSDADKLMAMVGGHPYLVRLALYHLVGKGGLENDLGQILQQAPTDTGIYRDYLHQYMLMLQQETQLANAFREVVTVTEPVKIEPRLAYQLHSMGLVKLEGDRVSVACELFRLYFREKLNTSNSDSNWRVAELEKENQKLRILYSIDELTQLANRRYFHTYLQLEWQRSKRELTPLSMILCDIDYFKIYNKTYGNNAGNICLQQIARTIHESIKHFLVNNHLSYVSTALGAENSRNPNIGSENNSLLVARYGGEEFAILLDVDAVTAVYIAEKIREQIKALAITCEYPGIGGLPANVLTVSLGVASMIPEGKSEPEILVNTAEKALYQAKRKGRDRVILG
ncbi:diguanylate cyclase [Fischerella thermalis CCMEE 5330]|uniref:Diguanylate cyclase n=1 Tax=Fischerella thermalis CCMEE 5330 TaxID=2019670 RepID=A0A2N6MIL4_9CYAN|nr:AAA-like domain-containing protein [Fischerella thermalis]PMB46588.1 diguanylate cyclase [Fischerella thermalis CCMEE 5330]